MLSTVIPAGQLVFSEGEAAECAYLVEEGWIEIFIQRGSRRQVLSLIGPGEIFGEMGVIDGSPRSASAVAAEDCRVLVVNTEQFQALLGRTEPFHAELLGKLVSRFRNAQKSFLDGTEIVPTSLTSNVGPGYAILARHRDVSQAMDRGEIEAFLQPVVDMADGRWLGFEALARWRCPKRGLLPPSDFLPLAERTGLIRRIDLLMADKVMDLCQGFDGPDAPFFNVNFSAWHFRNGRLPSIIAEMMDRHHLPPNRIHMELTETLILDDPDRALSIMTDLAGMGVKLALDDFGTGYSSLSVLHRMPIHILKIDRSLVVGVLEPGRPRSILLNTITLANSLGMEIVAEGIEDAETVSALLDFGCRVGQGYLFARPMPAADAIAAWAQHGVTAP